MPERGSSIIRYLVELNQELEVRLGRRRRILTEIEDHLLTATAVAIADGASPSQAERTATTALGTPQEVANTFGRDVLSILDRRLRSLADAADRLARSHRVGRLARDWPPFASVIASLAIAAAAGLLPWSAMAVVSIGLLPLFASLSFFGGTSSPVDPRKTHIPWAASYPWGMTVIYVSGTTTSPVRWSILLTYLVFIVCMTLGFFAVDRIETRVSTWVGLSAACVLINPILVMRLAAGSVEPFNAWSSAVLSVLYGLSLLVGGAWSKARAQREDLDAQLGAGQSLRYSGPTASPPAAPRPPGSPSST